MSLLTEKPLVIPPQLAVTLGLEEAVLLQVLYEVTLLNPPRAAASQPGFEVGSQQLSRLTPFWNGRDIQRISNSLRDQGVLEIHSGPFESSGLLRFSLQGLHAGDRLSPTRTPPGRQRNRAVTTGKGANLIAPNWQPDEEALRQLALYGVPQAFALEQIPEFVIYWHERGEPRHSWNAKFIKQTLRSWRSEQAAAAQKGQQVTMLQSWRPSGDAINILRQHAEINANFIEDAIPEFILYWQERGIASSTWNSQFIQHVKRQWVKFTSALEHESDPHVISPDWTPSEDLFEVLDMANIPRAFAEKEIPAFVLFWRETGRAHNSWNTKFLQHVKRQWAYSQSQTAEIHHGKQQKSHQPVSTRATSIIEDLSDRSWAN